MFKRMTAFIMALCLVMSLYGCATILVAGAGGVGTAFWLSGKLSETLNSPYDRTVQAAKDALKSLDLEITKKTEKLTVTQLMSKYADGSTVWVDIRPINKSTTKVEVRVGARGNKEASGKILTAVKKHL